MNYACYKEAFVVDSYTKRLLDAFGYTLNLYEEIQDWMLEGIYRRTNELFPEMKAAQAYARAHGMVVEYCKENKIGRKIDIEPLSKLIS